MSLHHYIDTYCNRRDVSNGYVAQLHWAVNAIERHAGRQLSASDLTEDLLNSHLRECKLSDKSGATRKSRRRNILIIWQAAADDGLCEPPNRRHIMNIREKDRIPRGYSIEDANKLIRSAEKIRGSAACEIPLWLWWSSYIRAMWDTGMRGCDVRSLERNWIPASGQLTIIQSKSGKCVRNAFRDSTLTLIDQMFPPDRRLIWPLTIGLRQFQRQGRSIVKRAGLQGSLKWLRSGSGTLVEELYPGRGHEHLGNTRAVFERNYLSPDLMQSPVLMPPELR